MVEVEYLFHSMDGKSLKFMVKAPQDFCLAFSSEDRDTCDMFEVLIGAWKGTASAIRFKKDKYLVKESTLGILNREEAREFWVTFDDDLVRVGHMGQRTPFMEAALPEPINVTHYGYPTDWGIRGVWQFYSQRIVMTEDSEIYNFEPVYGSSYTFSVQCVNDAYIGLTSAAETTPKMYEFIIGGWKNTESAIRLDLDTNRMYRQPTPDIVSNESFRTFYITFKGGLLQAFRKGSSTPFLEYLDEDPITITHIGYKSCWGSTGKWKLEG